MKQWTLLTATRNDGHLLVQFLDEVRDVLGRVGMLERTRLWIVNDFTLDETRSIVDDWCARGQDLRVDVIDLPTNLGNQGAMAYGIRQIPIPDSGFVMSLDSDGEDDLQRIPEIVSACEACPDRVFFTERGHRKDSGLIRLLYYFYRKVFVRLTGRCIMPNNYMVLPARYLDAVRRAPLLPVYYSMAVLRLGLPYQSAPFDRRLRYGGRSSQNLYNLMSHAFVGLMMFYETVIPKVLSWLVLSIAFFIGTSGFALFAKFVKDASLPGWTALFLALNFGFIVFLGSLLVIMSVFAISFKLAHYYLADIPPLDLVKH